MHHTQYYSRLYRDFRAIEADNYRKIVHFYETREKQILELGFAEYFEMLVAYGNALFEVGEYQKQLLIADVIVETSIAEGFAYFKGEEIYETTLFRKAAAYYNLMEYPKAIHILTQLVRLNPQNTYNIKFLERCFLREKRYLIRLTNAVTIIFFLLSAFIIAIEILVIRNFYLDFAPKVEIGRNVLFALGIVVYALGHVVHYWRVQQQIEKLR